MLALVDAQGAECVMVEDIVLNLRPAKALGLTLHDHLIIGKSVELSFRAEGLL